MITRDIGVIRILLSASVAFVIGAKKIFADVILPLFDKIFEEKDVYPSSFTSSICSPGITFFIKYNGVTPR